MSFWILPHFGLNMVLGCNHVVVLYHEPKIDSDKNTNKLRILENNRYHDLDALRAFAMSWYSASWSSLLLPTPIGSSGYESIGTLYIPLMFYSWIQMSLFFFWWIFTMMMWQKEELSFIDIG